MIEYSPDAVLADEAGGSMESEFLMSADLAGAASFSWPDTDADGPGPGPLVPASSTLSLLPMSTEAPDGS